MRLPLTNVGGVKGRDVIPAEGGIQEALVPEPSGPLVKQGNGENHKKPVQGEKGS
jgi:hypothetical protein